MLIESIGHAIGISGTVHEAWHGVLFCVIAHAGCGIYSLWLWLVAS